MEGDYRVPNLIVPEEDQVVLGKYALLRKKYLKQHRRILFVNLLTGGTLNQHLMEIEQTALNRMELLTAQMAKAEGVTEQMKATDQMKWVGLMNNIRHSAEETILNDLIYS
ncbi:MAG: TnpV protein [Eubacteriales bacterium]|nr:TnpV protein [Eubacteriales bacterium]